MRSGPAAQGQASACCIGIAALAVAEVIANPDTIRRSVRSATVRLFSRWYSDIRQGRHIVVVVRDGGPAGRHWILTAYMAGRIAAGEIEWQRR